MPGFHAAGNHRQVVVDTNMRMLSAPEDLPVTARLHYSTRDPFAVSVVFSTDGCAPVVWVFARDLLLGGVVYPTGVGDVQIYPAGDFVVFDLASPDGAARVLARKDEMITFANDMVVVVPLGEEMAFIDMDSELAALEHTSFAQWGEA